jgi:hypothetical protein
MDASAASAIIKQKYLGTVFNFPSRTIDHMVSDIKTHCPIHSHYCPNTHALDSLLLDLSRNFAKFGEPGAADEALGTVFSAFMSPITTCSFRSTASLTWCISAAAVPAHRSMQLSVCGWYGDWTQMPGHV